MNQLLLNFGEKTSMKLKLKMIAAAATMASLAGAAQADIVTSNTQSGSLVLTAFNTVTNSYYMRDLGFTLSSFLPSGVLDSVGFTGSPIVGDKTPDAGLTLNAGNTANFGDAAFSTWYSAQTPTDVKWYVNAVDTISTAALGVSRIITSSLNSGETSTNGQLNNFQGSASGAELFFNPATLSTTGSAAETAFASAFATNFGLGADGLAAVGETASLFYFARTAATGSTATLANGGRYGNATDFATVTLAANGDFTYQLNGEAAVVPLPAAAWLMGAGLLGLGGAARRRKASAQAKAA
jgi:hypothetical protein